MKVNQAEFSISAMCRVLEVSPSGYYAWRSRGRSSRAQADAVLSERVKTIHEDSDGTYGVARIHAELKEEQMKVGAKRLARLMKEQGLRGVCRRRSWKTTVRDERQRPAQDLVEREFSAQAPNQLWVADITYVPTWSGFLFLAVVLDVFSRRIVGWAMATHLRAELVLEALEMALTTRRPAHGVIHHSDQGSQYTSLAFGKRCEHHGVSPSMGSVGDCYDNAMCESFFATLECELIARRRFKDPAEAQLAVFKFIEGWYNPRRRHSSIGYVSPAVYEDRYLEANRLDAHPVNDTDFVKQTMITTDSMPSTQ